MDNNFQLEIFGFILAMDWSLKPVVESNVYVDSPSTTGGEKLFHNKYATNFDLRKERGMMKSYSEVISYGDSSKNFSADTKNDDQWSDTAPWSSVGYWLVMARFQAQKGLSITEVSRIGLVDPKKYDEANRVSRKRKSSNIPKPEVLNPPSFSKTVRKLLCSSFH